jgi:hypothetical protein
MEWNREQNHLARRRRRHYLVHRGIPRFALSARWRSHSARAPAVRRRSARRAIHSSASINYPVGATRPPTCVRSVGPLEPGLGQRKSGLVPSKTTGAAVQVWANAAGARAGKARSVQRGRRYAMTVTDFKRRGSTVTTPVERSCRPLYFWNGTRPPSESGVRGIEPFPHGDCFPCLINRDGSRPMSGANQMRFLSFVNHDSSALLSHSATCFSASSLATP